MLRVAFDSVDSAFSDHEMTSNHHKTMANLISRTMIGRDVAVNKWGFHLGKVAMKGVT